MRTTCFKCGKPLDGKHKSYCKACFNARKREWYASNREKALASSKEWQEADPARWAKAQRKSKLKRAYGLTLEEFEAMSAAQGHSCRVCSTPFSESDRGGHVDHDHESGEVRGLLCGKCNRGIGYFDDDPDRLLAAAFYLERHRMKQHAKE